MSLILFFCAATAVASPAQPPVTVALVVGNNASPIDEPDLAPLRFADDDAVRFFELFLRAAQRVELLSVLDDRTQARHASAASRARLPTLAELDAAVRRLAGELESASVAGRSTRAYVTFSGHGSSQENGEPYLAFLDGALTGDELFNRVVAKLPADRVHLIIDACNAGAVVGMRGRFDKELDGERVEVSKQALSALAKNRALERYPHVGVVAAASAGQEAHEWERIESGVFTHEVLSALAGPADVNGDLAIEYSELQAFIAAANSAVRDPRAKPTIVASAPKADRRAPLLALTELKDTGFLRGQAPGRFFVELANGQRFLDAHLDTGAETAIALPAETPLYVRTSSREASIAASAGGVIAFDDLELRARAVASRGATDETYRRDLFSVPYGVTYYQGYVDSQSLLPVKLDGVRADLLEPGFTREEVLAYSAWGVGLAGFAAAGFFAIQAAQTRSDFNSTSVQREAME
ncbi:MAG: caspase family protein, partial [Myxococcota bacterium]